MPATKSTRRSQKNTATANKSRAPAKMGSGSSRRSKKNGAPASKSQTSAEEPGTASNKVFTTPELLESILLDLSPTELLLAQRVDKTFQATIKGSVKAQRKLFFRLDKDDESAPASEPVLNPFLQRMFPLNSPNETILGISARICPVTSQMSIHLPIVDPTRGLGEVTVKKLNKAKTYKKASWRKMWPTNTALPIHPVMADYETKHAGEGDFARMGKVMDVLTNQNTYFEAMNLGYNNQLHEFEDDESEEEEDLGLTDFFDEEKSEDEGDEEDRPTEVEVGAGEGEVSWGDEDEDAGNEEVAQFSGNESEEEQDVLPPPRRRSRRLARRSRGCFIV